MKRVASDIQTAIKIIVFRALYIQSGYDEESCLTTNDLGWNQKFLLLIVGKKKNANFSNKIHNKKLNRLK